MNEFILNYVKNDITGRAIMLTGEWGSGKSFYIKDKLKPFLELKKNGQHKCVIVSLYGLSDTSEISKAMYMELRTIKKSASSEAANTAKVVGKIVGKTIFNGLASKIGFDIGGISDDDLKKVYESVDLTDKLIVLEDMERTQIDIIELLGYINNMCENDGVKVLIVANENEIIKKNKKNDIFTSNNEEKKDENTELFIQQYNRIREKTIGDTVYFMYDRMETVTAIVKKFQCTDFDLFHKDEEIKNICDILFLKTINNFRTLIFACQKTVDIFKSFSDNNISMDEQFKRPIFYGLIILSDMMANGGLIKWNGDKYLSSTWGIWYLPVFRFCYDYLQYQTFDVEFIRETISNYNDFLKYDSSASIKDADVDVIYCYYIHTEQELKNSLQRVEQKLKENNISFYEYGRLINSIFSIRKHLEGSIDIDIEKYKSIILDNLKGHDGKVSIDNMFRYVEIPFIDDDEVKQEIELFRQKMNDVLSDVKTPLTGFKYKTDEIKNLSDYVRQNRDTEMEKGKFAGFFDIERFVDMYKICSSSDMDDIYVMFCQAYYRRNDLVTIKDKENLTQLYDKVEQLQNYYGFDTIQKLQCKRFVNTLKTIIENSE